MRREQTLHPRAEAITQKQNKNKLVGNTSAVKLCVQRILENLTDSTHSQYTVMHIMPVHRCTPVLFKAGNMMESRHSFTAVVAALSYVECGRPLIVLTDF